MNDTNYIENSKTTEASQPPAGSDTKAPASVPKSSLFSDLYDWLEIFAVSIAVIFFVFAFVARIAVVDGNSMNHTLQGNDKLLVRQLFYTPKQGDIVVCQSERYGMDKPLVKRIIALEGQTVRLDTETWTVYVNDEPIEEDYVFYRPGVSMIGWSYGESYTVPEGHVFVMGDNRNDSLDSRSLFVGPIDERYIVGEVIFRILPLSSFGFVD